MEHYVGLGGLCIKHVTLVSLFTEGTSSFIFVLEFGIVLMLNSAAYVSKILSRLTPTVELLSLVS